MKQITKPGSYLFWKGELCMVIAIGTGKTIHMVPVDKSKECEKCHAYIEHSVLEGSPLFEENAEAVTTLQE